MTEAGGKKSKKAEVSVVVPASPESGSDTALLLTAATGILRYLLENGQVRYNLPATLGADLTLSSLPPDRIKTGDEERPQINLYLYQVNRRGLAANSRFAEDVPTGIPKEKIGMESEFELLYLVTVFGAADFHWEILLGYALALLRETPILTGDRMRDIVRRISGDGDSGREVSSALAALRTSPLPNRFNEARLVLLAPPVEQVSQIWSLLQARYRPSLFLRCTVLLDVV